MKSRLIIIALTLAVVIDNGCVSVDDKPRESDLAGTYHQVKPGDTLLVIAKKYNVPVDEIMYINGIEKERGLRVGQALFLPDPDPIGKKIAKLKPASTKKAPPQKTATAKKSTPNPSRMFDFPVPGGTVIQDFSLAKKNPYDGIGIKASKGARILASLDGRVLFVGDDGTKFGLIVILEHVDPYITVYAHLDRAVVKAGQKLKRGEVLGYVGQSGGVSSPHLHFQIRVSERPKDPKLYLKNSP